jgi:hypothetical protein
MFTLILTAIIATGVATSDVTVRIEHQVIGTNWATKEKCEEAARAVLVNHLAAYQEIKSMQSHPRHGGPYARTLCLRSSSY